MRISDKLEQGEIVGLAIMAIGMAGMIGGVDNSGWLIFIGLLWASD